MVCKKAMLAMSAMPFGDVNKGTRVEWNTATVEAFSAAHRLGISCIRLKLGRNIPVAAAFT